jgi:hypothetical protein
VLGFYAFDMQRSNFSSLNTLDARRHALGETRLRTSPFTTIGLTALYDRTQTPGEINADTGVLGERRPADRLELTPTFARRLTPRATLTGGYNFTTERLVDGERGTMHTGRIGVGRDVTPRTSLSVSYVGRHFLANDSATIDGDPEQSSHAVVVGWERQMTPATRLALSAGPKATSYDGFEVEVSAGVLRTTPRIRTAIDYWHGETIVLGIDGPVAVDSVTARVNWLFRHRMEAGFHAGVSDVGTLEGRTATIYSGTLIGSWSPNDMYTLAATYGLDFQDGTIRYPIFLDDDALPLEERLRRHVFRVSVTIAPRYKRSILPPEEAARAKGVTR